MIKVWLLNKTAPREYDNDEYSFKMKSDSRNTYNGSNNCMKLLELVTKPRWNDYLFIALINIKRSVIFPYGTGSLVGQ